jgi:hypothetical protein
MAELACLVLREGTALVSVGTAFGFPGAFAMSKILSALTSEFADAFQIGTIDLRLLVGVPVLLGSPGSACVPARTAAQIDPPLALRQD